MKNEDIFKVYQNYQDKFINKCEEINRFQKEFGFAGFNNITNRASNSLVQFLKYLKSKNVFT